MLQRKDDPQVMEITLDLRERASGYFADFEGHKVRVHLLRAWYRMFASIYQFELQANNQRHMVVVKVPVADLNNGTYLATEQPPTDGKARFVCRPDPEGFEHNALTAIHDHFEQLADPRFGSVRVLEHLRNGTAIVMEGLTCPSLSRLLRGATRLNHLFKPVDLDPILHNTGAWLRAYHQAPKLDQTETRDASREGYIDSIQESSEYLAHVDGNAELMLALQSQVTSAAQALLPKTLPLGTAHDDYAPRNIYVDTTGRVTVLDTLAAWRAPIYEDISLFLVALQTNKLQSYTQGLAYGPAVMQRYERAFLSGYFQRDDYDRTAVRLFEIQALLNKWAGAEHILKGIRGTARVLYKSRLALQRRYYMKNLRYQLRGIAQDRVGSKRDRFLYQAGA